MSPHAELLLTAVQREALAEFVRLGGVVYVNQKRDGFEEFRTRQAVALIIAGAAAVEGQELRLTPLGEMLRGDGQR